MIIYKDILGKLSAAGYSSYRLRKEKLFTESTIQRIRQNKPINTETLDRVCKLTGLPVADLLEYKAD